MTECGRSMCTCTDEICPNRLDKAGSCTRCVAKCLAQSEIPCCFFYQVAAREEIAGDWSFRGFARVVAEKEKKRNAGS